MLESKVGKSLKPYSFPRSTFFGCLKHDQFTSVASVSIHISSYLWSHHAPHLCVPHPDPPKVSQSPIPMASEAFWNPDLIFLSQGFVFGSFNITWGAVFGHVSVFFFCVFCVCVICVCFSPFCDLYTYISPWNSGKNKLAVAQRRIQTLFWRDFLEVMRRKAEVALLQKHGLNDANPDCLIVLVCQGPLNGVTGFLEISRFPCNCLRIHSFFLVLFVHFPRLHGGDPAFLMMWLAFLKTHVCNCLYVKATAKMLWDEEVFLFFGGAMDIHPSKLHKKQWFLKVVRGSWLNEFLL